MKIPTAVVFFLSAVFLSPPVVASDDMFDIAAQHFEGKNYVKALLLYERAIQGESASEDKLARAYLELGQCYHYVKRPDDAIAAFRAVGDSFPNFLYADSARKWLGDCYVLKNELDTAVAIFKGIVTHYTDTQVAASAHFELGRTLFTKKDYDSASTEFMQFLGLYPDHPQARQSRMYIQRIKRIKG